MYLLISVTPRLELVAPGYTRKAETAKELLQLNRKIAAAQKKLNLHPSRKARWLIGVEWSFGIFSKGRIDMPIVVASSFADPKDVAAYKKAISQGKTEAEALKIGDNGIGKWGDNTASDVVPMCALPPEVWMAKWGLGSHARGKKASVTYKGRTVIGELRDTMPHKANIKNGAGIDLNPGFAKAFGVSTPFMLQGVRWEWV